jgi:chromodomain-helicase-DNA-binding protein 1
MDDDLAWDEIIPVEERVKLDEEESKALQAEEAALANRRRAAARGPGTYEGMDHDELDAGSSQAGGGQKGGEKKKKANAAAPRKSNQQKALELKGESGDVCVC